MSEQNSTPDTERRAATDRRESDDPAYPGPERRTGDRRVKTPDPNAASDPPATD